MSVFRIKISDKPSRFYYGKLRTAPNRYRRVKLHAVGEGKRASVRKLRSLQVEHDQSHGRSTSALAHEKTFIETHRDAYLGYLATQSSNDRHLGITRSVLSRLFKAAGWSKLGDINSESAIKAISAIASTQSYRNQYVKRLRAFVNWCLLTDRFYSSPIRALRRFNERGSHRNRARRSASRIELDKLWGIDLPDYRRLAYALASCNGLRRDEQRRLNRRDISFIGDIPFMKIRHKMGEGFDVIPIHPYVLSLLRGWQYQPDGRVFAAVPDVATLQRDLKRAAVLFKDHEGNRLDFHALRHTFATELDRAQTSRATKKRLLRHAASDVTDGYSHADLAEACEALLRIHSPLTRQLDQISDRNFKMIPAFAVESAVLQTEQNLREADELATLIGAGLDFGLWPDTQAGSGSTGISASSLKAFLDFRDQKLDRSQRRRIEAAMVRLRALQAQGRISGEAFAGLKLLAGTAA